MKMEKFSTPTALQKCLWWTVLRGRNVICITPYNSGKTLGYLVPILNSLLNNKRNGYECENKEYGPIVLILVSICVNLIRFWTVFYYVSK